MENKFFQDNNPKRQKLIKPLSEVNNLTEELIDFENSSAKKLKASKVDLTLIKNQIQSVDELRFYLRTALQLELSTIPPYLCGLYSIKEGGNQQAAGLIRSVVVEEMLHMILVANILNAISSPADLKKESKEFSGKLFDVEKIIPDYPTKLPGNIYPPVGKGKTPFKVSLLKFSQEAIDEFCTIERPSNPTKEVKPKTSRQVFPKYESIGQFYEAIRYGLYRFKNQITKPEKNKNGKTYYKFIGDESRQVGPEHYYGSGGKILKVIYFGGALEAIEEIVGQGEGVDGTIQDPDFEMFGEGIEYAHYFKFQEINYGRLYHSNDTNYDKPTNSIPSGPSINRSWSSVYNMKPNPKMADYKDNPQLLDLAKNFNETYVTLLNNINDAVSGDPDKLVQGIALMYDLKYKALELLKIPLNDGTGECAGPTFEYVKV
ncbi:ferritin-like protein [Algoriphagus sp.]|uniref:ferritin-like domain-containing protein n=1 Tax=Algoriphagus sp. TaxID=1872435 RepID=UPI0025FD1A10|nr:ferritin-like protein [Algoriphagus sp.]